MHRRPKKRQFKEAAKKKEAVAAKAKADRENAAQAAAAEEAARTKAARKKADAAKVKAAKAKAAKVKAAKAKAANEKAAQAVLRVGGAGSPEANGLYRRCQADAYGKPQYCKIDDPHAIIYWYPTWAGGGPWWEIGRRWKGDQRGVETPERESDPTYDPDAGLGSVGFGLHCNKGDNPTPPRAMDVFKGRAPAPTVELLVASPA